MQSINVPAMVCCSVCSAVGFSASVTTPSMLSAMIAAILCYVCERGGGAGGENVKAAGAGGRWGDGGCGLGGKLAGAAAIDVGEWMTKFHRCC